MKKLIVLLFLLGSVFAASKASERKVAGNGITSERDPKVEIREPASAKYLGADRWTLYDIADCELHVFVEVNAKKQVKRLYWIQFEGYIPEMPTMKYTYDSPRRLKLGKTEFIVDTWVNASVSPTRPGSDTERVRALIAKKGYTLPAGMAYVRLVNLKPHMRKELMIIYGEELPPGLSAADVDERGKQRGKWAGIETKLLQGAQQRVQVKRLSW